MHKILIILILDWKYSVLLCSLYRKNIKILNVKYLYSSLLTKVRRWYSIFKRFVTEINIIPQITVFIVFRRTIEQTKRLRSFTEFKRSIITINYELLSLIIINIIIAFITSIITIYLLLGTWSDLLDAQKSRGISEVIV